jgi:CheY-like chemotaxis protein
MNSQQTSVKKPVSSLSSQTATTGAPVEQREVIDSVFTQIGFDQLFLDVEHNGRVPHLDIKDANTPMVLHIDDDVDLVNAVTARFKANGFRVACALDGEGGIKEALKLPADAIVLDYDMPNGRGDTVIDLLKGNEKTRDIPIVVLTAVHKKGLKRQLLNRGADRFMTKPFDFSELQETVTELIEDSEN